MEIANWFPQWKGSQPPPCTPEPRYAQDIPKDVLGLSGEMTDTGINQPRVQI